MGTPNPVLDDHMNSFERHRAAGNGAFDSGRFIEASEEYTQALQFSIEKSEAHDVCVVRANRAAAFCKRQKWQEAMEDCSWVIARPLEAGPVCLAKSLFRRAFAHEGIGDAESAIRDLRAAEKLCPNDAFIKNHLRNYESPYHLVVVLNRASKETLARQKQFRRFKPETRVI